MGCVSMNRKTRDQKHLTEAEIDDIVVGQAEDEAAWEASIYVHRDEPTSVNIPAELAARAAFLAQVHRQANVEEWLTRIIRERVELEEAAFAGAKRELVMSSLTTPG